MDKRLTMRFTFVQRLFIFFLCMFIFSLIGILIIGLINRNGLSTQTLRIATVIQDCFIFILPAVVTACLVCSLPARFLSVDRSFTPAQFVLAVLCLKVSMPVMNFIVKLNNELVLPESLHSLEVWMRNAEQSAQDSVRLLMGTPTIGSLIINLLIIAFLAGFSEEVFFRGVLMRLLSSGRRNAHIAIWITALIFSAFHFQFYGFIPRMLLGAYFGYLLVWSKSLWLPILAHAFNNALVVMSMHATHIKGEEAMKEINNFGEDSFTLILASIILTIFILRYLIKYRTR